MPSLLGITPSNNPSMFFPLYVAHICSRCDLNASKYRSSFRKRTKGMNRSLSKTVSTGAQGVQCDDRYRKSENGRKWAIKLPLDRNDDAHLDFQWSLFSDQPKCLSRPAKNPSGSMVFTVCWYLRRSTPSGNHFHGTSGEHILAPS